MVEAPYRLGNQLRHCDEVSLSVGGDERRRISLAFTEVRRKDPDTGVLAHFKAVPKKYQGTRTATGPLPLAGRTTDRAIRRPISDSQAGKSDQRRER